MNSQQYDYENYYSGAELIALSGEPEMMGFIFPSLLPTLVTRLVAKKIIKKKNPKLYKKLEAKRLAVKKKITTTLAKPFKAIAARKAARVQAQADAQAQADLEAQQAAQLQEEQSATMEPSTEISTASAVPGLPAGFNLKDPKVLIPVAAGAGLLVFSMLMNKKAR